MKNPKIIAVDFDGTIVENRYPEIGPPIHSTVRALRTEMMIGSKLILWTCRVGQHLEDAIKCCKNLGIEFDEINKNVQEVIDEFGGDTRKIFADEYWDDRAVKFPIDDGKGKCYSD